MQRETDGVTPLADAQRQDLVHRGKRRAARPLAPECLSQLNRLTIRRTTLFATAQFHRPPPPIRSKSVRRTGSLPSRKTPPIVAVQMLSGKRHLLLIDPA